MIELQGETSVLAFTMNVTEEKRREALLIDLATGVSGDTGLPFFRSLVRHMAQALGADLVIVGEMQTPGTVQTLAGASSKAGWSPTSNTRSKARLAATPWPTWATASMPNI